MHNQVKEYSYQKAIGSWFIWRVVVFCAAWWGGRILPFAPRFPYSAELLIATKLPYWVWSMANFDGVHYLTIAKSGYSAQYTQVFFPLYPILISFGSNMLPPLISGLVISNVCLLVALMVFYSLVRLDFSAKIAAASVVSLLCFPTAFFLGSLYTEGLFFMLLVASFLSARKGYWVAAGILGGLASATRSVGVFLLPALLWEWLQQHQVKGIRQKAKVFYSPLLFIFAGIGSYMIYLQVKFGDALYFWHAQPVFGAQRSGNSIILLPQVMWRYMKILTSVPIQSETFWIPLAEMLFTLVTIAILVYAHTKNIRRSYLIFSWIALIVPTLTGTFSSMPRYVLVVFPLYMVIGSIERKWLRMSIYIVCIAVQMTFIVLFTRGHWVS